MAYQLFISEEALEQVRGLPEDLRKNIGYRLHLLQQEFSWEHQEAGRTAQPLSASRRRTPNPLSHGRKYNRGVCCQAEEGRI